jgi:hypothetical protein
MGFTQIDPMPRQPRKQPKIRLNLDMPLQVSKRQPKAALTVRV